MCSLCGKMAIIKDFFEYGDYCKEHINNVLRWVERDSKEDGNYYSDRLNYFKPFEMARLEECLKRLGN